MKCFRVIVLGMVWFSTSWAQPNMVSNGGFEALETSHLPEYATFEKECDNREGAYVFYENHTIGTVYQLGVPNNMFGSQQPHGGMKYSGLISQYRTVGLTTECFRGGKIVLHLNETIHKGHQYTLKFFTSHMDDSDVDAQLEVTLDNDQSVFDFSISDKTNWQEKTVTFTADDDYDELVFDVTNEMLFTNNLTGVYIDDVRLFMSCKLAEPCSSLDPIMAPTFTGNPINQTTAFKMDDLENVQICSITIWNYLSQVVYSKLVECETGIDQPLYWKGVNNSGSAVANGTYTYEISVTNDCGSRTYSGTIVKSATFTGSVTEFSCDANAYNAPLLCCEFEPDLLLDNLQWVNQDLLFHAISEIIVASSNPVTVGSGSDVIMRAGERIELNPGFSTDGAGISDASEAGGNFDHQIIPNPNNGEFSIRFESSEREDIQLQLLDMNGKILFDRNLSVITVLPISFTGLDSGIYLLKVIRQQSQVTEKIIVL